MRLYRNNLTARIFVILFTLTLLATPLPALAQSKPTIQPSTKVTPVESPGAGINLTISPAFLNLTADPGEVLQSEFRIMNNSNFTENLTIEIQKFIIGEDGKPVLTAIGPEDTFVKWVTFSEPRFSVASNQTKTVKFTVTPPTNASLGYYYAFVINRVRDNEQVTQGATITGSPALLTLLEVRSANAKREVQLVDFKTDKLWYEYLPTNFIIKVKNTGNVHVFPSGNVFIDQGGKKDIAILSANESHGNVLPQSEREFTSTWDDGFAVIVPKEENNEVVKNDKGEIIYETKYDFQKADKFRIGKYTANLLLVYNNGERDIPLEAQVSFWIIPWKEIGGVVLILLFVLLGVRSAIVSNYRRFKKK